MAGADEGVRNMKQAAKIQPTQEEEFLRPAAFDGLADGRAVHIGQEDLDWVD